MKIKGIVSSNAFVVVMTETLKRNVFALTFKFCGKMVKTNAAE